MAPILLNLSLFLLSLYQLEATTHDFVMKIVTGDGETTLRKVEIQHDTKMECYSLFHALKNGDKELIVLESTSAGGQAVKRVEFPKLSFHIDHSFTLPTVLKTRALEVRNKDQILETIRYKDGRKQCKRHLEMVKYPSNRSDELFSQHRAQPRW